MKHSDVAIIVPVHNEEQVVGAVIKKVKKIFHNVICVDDGSADSSAKEIQNSGATLVQHPFNLGAGAAIQTGIDYALQDPETKYFITFDADDQHDVHDALRMLEYLKEHKLDIVLGSRFIGKAHNISRIKKIFLKLAVKFSNTTSGIRLTDAHNGLRVFNRKVAEGLNITMPDMAHASEIIHQVAERQYSYAEVPVTISYTDYSKSKGQPMVNAINISVDLLFHKIAKK